MKRAIGLVLVILLVLSFGACEKKSEFDSNEIGSQKQFETSSNISVTDDTKQTESDQDTQNLDGILATMVATYENTSQSVKSKYENVVEKIGNSYSSYDTNKKSVSDFYDFSLRESEHLYEMLNMLAVDYFKCVADSGLENSEAWNEAMDDFYNMWDEGMNNYYNTLNEYYEVLYSKCNGIIEGASKELDYSDSSKIWSQMYKEYSDSWSAMYKSHWDAWSKNYGNYWDVWREFLKGNSDVDRILNHTETGVQQNITQEKAGTFEVSGTVSHKETTENNSSDSTVNNRKDSFEGMRPEFKAAMDSYEEFYDKYFAFLEKYKENPTDLTLIANYTEMLEKLDEMNKNFEKWGNDNLNNTELGYYLEVTNRITQKMIEHSN